MLPAAFLAFAMVATPVISAAAQQPPAAHGKMKPMQEGDMLEKHIAHLHDMLKVTAEQDPQWQPVAQTMRDNDKALHEVIKSKQGMIDTQSAVDDLNAYAEIADTHAQNAKKMAAAFGTFYATLNDDQKKIADTFFREHKHHNANTAHGRSAQQH
jgi:hypothetical protein